MTGECRVPKETQTQISVGAEFSKAPGDHVTTQLGAHLPF